MAEEKGEIVGLIDVELDSDDLVWEGPGRGAILWHLAVLPEQRRKGLARKLWEEARRALLGQGIRCCEVWTQEDEAANGFYQAMGFQLQPDQCWLRCYVRGESCNRLLREDALRGILGSEELIFDAPLGRKADLKGLCCRMDEVRLYRVQL